MHLPYVPTELVHALTPTRIATLAAARAHPLPARASADALAAHLDSGPTPLSPHLATLAFLLLDPAGERAHHDAVRATGLRPAGPAYEDHCLQLVVGDTAVVRRTRHRVIAAATRSPSLVHGLCLACDGPSRLAGLGSIADVVERLISAFAPLCAQGAGPAAVHASADHGHLRVHVTVPRAARGGAPRVVSAALSLREGQPVARLFAVAGHATAELALAFSRGLLERDDAIGFAPIVDLSPLQRGGARALAIPRSFSHLAEARLIAYEWDSGDDDHQRSTGHDTLRTNERRGHRLDPGTMTWAKVRLSFAQAPTRCDVELRRDAGFLVSEPSREDDVRTLATFWGLLDEAATRPRPAPTLFELEPWNHATHVWERAFGRDVVARLTKLGVLVPVTSRVVAHPARAGSGRVLVTLPLEGEDASWGVSDDPTVASRDVSIAERRALWLDLPRLGARLAAGLGTVSRPAETNARGVVDLGHRPLGTRALRFVLLTRSLGVGRTARSVLDALRRAALPDPLVVLVPPGCVGDTGHLEIALSALDTDGRDELRRAVIAAGLEDHVTARELAPPDARVVLCERTGDVYIDDVRLSKVGEQPLALLRALAERPGQMVSTDDLGARLSRAGDASATAREAKRNLVETVQAAFVRAGRKPGDAAGMIGTARGRGYVLAWPCWVRVGG